MNTSCFLRNEFYFYSGRVKPRHSSLYFCVFLNELRYLVIFGKLHSLSVSGIEKIASDHIKVLWVLPFYCFSQFTFACVVLFHKLAFASFDYHWYHLVLIWFRELCLSCLLWYDIETGAENRRILCLTCPWHGMTMKNRRQEKTEICLIQKKQINLVIKSSRIFRV